MNLTLTIDDALLKQARHISGASSDRELFERGLQALIQQNLHRRPLTTSRLKGIGKACEKLTPSTFETPDLPSVYQGPPLSLAEMEAAVLAEAERHS